MWLLSDCNMSLIDLRFSCWRVSPLYRCSLCCNWNFGSLLTWWKLKWGAGGRGHGHGDWVGGEEGGGWLGWRGGEDACGRHGDGQGSGREVVEEVIVKMVVEAAMEVVREVGGRRGWWTRWWKMHMMWCGRIVECGSNDVDRKYMIQSRWNINNLWNMTLLVILYDMMERVAAKKHENEMKTNVKMKASWSYA